MMRLLLFCCTVAIVLVENHASLLRHRGVQNNDQDSRSRMLQTQEPTFDPTQEETQEETQDSTSVPNTDVATEACCDSGVQPLCFVGDAACCRDGTWACSNDGIGEQYFCDGEDTTDPQGKVCCCDPLLEPGFSSENPLCFEGHRCCTDGTWACSSGIEGIYNCGGREVTSPGPFGEKCACPDDEFECPDGTSVGRDPATCEFLECPEEEEEEVNEAETLNTTQPQDEINNTQACCSPLVQASCGFGEPACCDDGSWACPSSEGSETYNCGGQETTNPSGEVCEVKCCNPFREPGMFGNNICFEGHACCPDTGEWSCSIGDGATFPCGDELSSGPFSKACRLIFCTNDRKECSDGSTVGLDPSSECEEFYPCPDEN